VGTPPGIGPRASGGDRHAALSLGPGWRAEVIAGGAGRSERRLIPIRGPLPTPGIKFKRLQGRGSTVALPAQQGGAQQRPPQWHTALSAVIAGQRQSRLGTQCPLNELREIPREGELRMPQTAPTRPAWRGHFVRVDPAAGGGQQAVGRNRSRRPAAPPRIQHQRRARAGAPASRPSANRTEPQLMALLGGGQRRRWWPGCWASCPSRLFAVLGPMAAAPDSRHVVYFPQPAPTRPRSGARSAKPSSLLRGSGPPAVWPGLADPGRPPRELLTIAGMLPVQAGVPGDLEAAPRPTTAQNAIPHQRHENVDRRRGNHTFSSRCSATFRWRTTFEWLRHCLGPGAWHRACSASIRPGCGEACSMTTTSRAIWRDAVGLPPVGSCASIEPTNFGVGSYWSLRPCSEHLLRLQNRTGR